MGITKDGKYAKVTSVIGFEAPSQVVRVEVYPSKQKRIEGLSDFEKTIEVDVMCTLDKGKITSGVKSLKDEVTSLCYDEVKKDERFIGWQDDI